MTMIIPPVRPAAPFAPRIALVGGGNMASALIGGLIDAGTPVEALRVLEIHPAAREALHARHGVLAAAQPAEVLDGATLVVLAVKPQQLAAVCRELQDALRSALVISIAAGVRTAELSRWLGGHTRIVRAMPNTPALVRAGVTGLFALPQVDAAERAQATALMEAVGKVVWVEQERALDAVTAISGSGPAYVFHFIEGLIAAGEQLGLSPQVAHDLALGTVAGAARLALGSEESPATLRIRVTSPGGTTQAALESFSQSDLLGAISRAVAAAAQRAVELGDQLARSDQGIGLESDPLRR
jgi:pyrroline-5-carboxylate reductase